MMPLVKQFEHLKIQLEAIKSATNNFADDNWIGKGGFGKVYKGELMLSKGQTIVAIKRLDRRFGQGNPEFWKEIILLSQYKHENIVSLLGFCDENDEKILVYEYASKGSLDMYLNNHDLTWIQHLKISIGAACGLAYLHDPGESQQRVLHRDIKSPNILLDENWNARISDLGLSKFGPANQQYTFLVSNTVGTFGYCDPLYLDTGFLTKESDVYSFGVVLFEILCGRLAIGNNDDTRRPLTRLVRQHYKANKINELVYSNIQDEITPKSLDTFVAIAYQCLRKDYEERPLMSQVVSMLENALKHQMGTLPDDTDPLRGLQSLKGTSTPGAFREIVFNSGRSKSDGCQQGVFHISDGLYSVIISDPIYAQLCIWNINGWEKLKSRSLQSPPGYPSLLVGDTKLQYHTDQRHLLVVHESQIAIYDPQLECLKLWSPRESLSAPISSAVYSCDCLRIFTGFLDGVVGVFDAETLSPRYCIALSAYVLSASFSSNNTAYPSVIAAHLSDPNQFALGMSSGSVHVIDLAKADLKFGAPAPQGSSTLALPAPSNSARHPILKIMHIIQSIKL